MAVVPQAVLHSQRVCFQHFPCAFLYPLLIFLSEEPKRCRHARITHEEFTPADEGGKHLPQGHRQRHPHRLQEEVQDILT